MDRTTARTTVASTLTGLGTYDLVNQGPPGKFAGRSPVAVITSRNYDLTREARDAAELTAGITLSIYVRHDADDGAAETQLDSLVRAAIVALYAVKVSGERVFFFDASTADIAGGNLRDVDGNGVLYRVERIPITVLEEGL